MTSAAGGVLLTGGSSRRMGFPKGTIVVDGVSLAARLGADLVAVCAGAPVVEVGPGVSGLPYVDEGDEQEGPLVAFGRGIAELARRGHAGDVLLLACDLPLVGVDTMRLLAWWEAVGSVVPVVAGRDQPLCARWWAAHAALVPSLVDEGARSMRDLLEVPGVIRIDESLWSAVLPQNTFADVDTAADLDRLGLDWSTRSG